MNVKFGPVVGGGTVLFLSLCGMNQIGRFQEAQWRVRTNKARTAERTGAARIREYQERNGALPVQSATDVMLSVPVGVQWHDILDPTRPKEQAPIRYWTGGEQAWLLTAFGPDNDSDTKPEAWMFNAAAVSDPRWLNLSYDPTNGGESDGDVLLASWQERHPQ